MRVLMSNDRDHGAVAVIVAVVSVVIFGLAAFAVDLGMAYTSKRDLQKGADAAALSAAKEVIRQASTTSTCAEIVANFNANTGGFADQIGSAADAYAKANRADASRQLLELRCSADNKRVEVVYEATGTTPTLFGGIFGQNSDYVAARRAVAEAFVPSGGLGLRPYALCLTDLNALKGGGWVRVRYPGADASLCGEYKGNWWTTDCPLDSNNGGLDENTDLGCRTEVSIIEPIGGVPVTRAQVAAACTGLTGKSPAPCLQSNPGNVAAQPVVNAWEELLASPGIAVPVFNKTWKDWADTDVPTCKSGGDGACYPVEAIAGVKVCGFKWANKDGVDPGEAIPGSPCAGVAADLALIQGASPADTNNYLWLKLQSVQITGSSKPSTCAVGDDPCDGGARGTRLIE